MSDYENNGCFCLDELTDGKASLKRLTDDLKAEYPVFLEKRDSASISELHITVKALWNEFSSLLHSVAEYDSGEIVIDPKELLEANWYRYDDLPLLPPPGTVARRLIEDTVAMCRAEYE